MGCLMTCIAHSIISGYRIEKNEMCMTCNSLGEWRDVYSVLGETRGKKTTWETNYEMGE